MDKYNGMEAFPDEEELSLLDILIVLAEQKKLIAAVTLAFAILGAAYAFYSASTVKIEAPKYTSEVQAVAEEARYILGEGELSYYRPRDMVKALVSSRSMMDDVLGEFANGGESGGEITAEDISIAANVRDNLITISVTTPAPELSMKIAAFVYHKTNAAFLAIGLGPSDGAGSVVREKRPEAPMHEFDKSRKAEDLLLAAPPMLELNMLLQHGRPAIHERRGTLQLVSPPSVPNDGGVAPQQRSTAKIIVLATILGIFCSVTLAFFRHFWMTADDPETIEKKNYLRKLLGFKPHAKA